MAQIMNQQNLVPVFGALIGNVLQVGGIVVSGYAILYLVRGVSTQLTGFIESLPRLFENPKSFWADTSNILIDIY